MLLLHDFDERDPPLLMVAACVRCCSLLAVYVLRIYGISHITYMLCMLIDLYYTAIHSSCCALFLLEAL